MAVIGEFTTTNGTIQGNVLTLTVKTRARLIPIERTSPSAPDYRAQAPNGAEIGAGWNEVSDDGEPYVSIKLDDPSFNAPINAALWPAQKEGEYVLVWNRPRRVA
ncbi:DUF736 domain-containing protein [Rhizobium freirei]|nr:DUF736 domain-containing protein [Rhizobium freirei]